MKVLDTYPPNYQNIRITLGDVSSVKPIFCYGKTIHNPFAREVTDDIILHEFIHSKQQGDNPENWWNMYLSNKEFRLDQEAEAYGAQYKFAKERGVRGSMLSWLKEKLAFELSGSAYGNLCSFGEAQSRIRNYEHTIQRI